MLPLLIEANLTPVSVGWKKNHTSLITIYRNNISCLFHRTSECDVSTSICSQRAHNSTHHICHFKSYLWPGAHKYVAVHRWLCGSVTGWSHLLVLVSKKSKGRFFTPSLRKDLDLELQPADYLHSVWMVTLWNLIKPPLISFHNDYSNFTKTTVLIFLCLLHLHEGAGVCLRLPNFSVSLSVPPSTSAAGDTRTERQVNPPSPSSVPTLPPNVTRLSRQWVLFCLIYFLLSYVYMCSRCDCKEAPPGSCPFYCQWEKLSQASCRIAEQIYLCVVRKKAESFHFIISFTNTCGYQRLCINNGANWGYIHTSLFLFKNCIFFYNKNN